MWTRIGRGIRESGGVVGGTAERGLSARTEGVLPTVSHRVPASAAARSRRSPDHVGPLTLGYLASPSKPLELRQYGIFERAHADQCAVLESQLLCTVEGLAVGVVTRDEDVDLHHRGVVNDVEGSRSSTPCAELAMEPPTKCRTPRPVRASSTGSSAARRSPGITTPAERPASSVPRSRRPDRSCVRQTGGRSPRLMTRGTDGQARRAPTTRPIDSTTGRGPGGAQVWPAAACRDDAVADVPIEWRRGASGSRVPDNTRAVRGWRRPHAPEPAARRSRCEPGRHRTPARGMAARAPRC